MTRAAVDHATARRAALVSTIWAPFAIVVLAEAVVVGVGVSAGHDLIIHWRDGGDRTGPWWNYAVLVAVTSLPIIVLTGIFIVRATRMAGTNTWIPAITVGVTVFHAVGLGAGPVLLNRSPLAPPGSSRC